jgi:hypothetical protein
LVEKQSKLKPQTRCERFEKRQENGIFAGEVVESRETRSGFLDSDLKEEPLNRRKRRSIGGERNRGGQSFRWTLKTRSTEC